MAHPFQLPLLHPQPHPMRVHSLPSSSSAPPMHLHLPFVPSPPHPSSPALLTSGQFPLPSPYVSPASASPTLDGGANASSAASSASPPYAVGATGSNVVSPQVGRCTHPFDPTCARCVGVMSGREDATMSLPSPSTLPMATAIHSPPGPAIASAHAPLVQLQARSAAAAQAPSQWHTAAVSPNHQYASTVHAPQQHQPQPFLAMHHQPQPTVQQPAMPLMAHPPSFAGLSAQSTSPPANHLPVGPNGLSAPVALGITPNGSNASVDVKCEPADGSSLPVAREGSVSPAAIPDASASSSPPLRSSAFASYHPSSPPLSAPLAHAVSSPPPAD
jgi:hypothetical protein